MLQFLKENGYPIDLEFETRSYEDEKEDFHGYKSDVFVDGVLYETLIHSEYKSRIYYADGFFSAYRWEAEGQYKWRGKEKTRRDDEILDVQVGDWIVDIHGKVRKVQYESDPDMPYESIKRFASEAEAEHSLKINELINLLNKTRRQNKSAWDTYGSELCAGDMLGEEKHIEDKIKELRDES